MDMSKFDKLLLIVNPKAGKTKAKNNLLDIIDVFNKAGYHVETYITQETKDAFNYVRQFAEQFNMIVCIGGDGTLSETVNGLSEIQNPPVLGYIPAGTTNDYAASLNISHNMLKAAKDIVEGQDCYIDIGLFSKNKYFVYIAAFGAFTEVAYLTPQDKKNILGHQAYLMEGVKSLANVKPFHMTIEYNERTIEGDFIFGMVTNTISVGGFKGLTAKKVELNDGMFEVLLVTAPKTAIDFTNIVSYILLREEENQYVQKFKTSYLKLTSDAGVNWVLDGEYGAHVNIAEITNIKQSLRFRINKPVKIVGK